MADAAAAASASAGSAAAVQFGARCNERGRSSQHANISHTRKKDKKTTFFYVWMYFTLAFHSTLGMYKQKKLANTFCWIYQKDKWNDCNFSPLFLRYWRCFWASLPPLYVHNTITQNNIWQKNLSAFNNLNRYRAHKFQNRLDEINDVSANRHFPDGKKKKKCSSDFSNSSSSTWWRPPSGRRGQTDPQAERATDTSGKRAE